MFHSNLSKVFRQSHLLNQQEEVQLFNDAIQNNDEEAKCKIINANLRLVAKIASSFNNNHFEHDDLFMYGLVGLIQATDLYDPNSNARFPTFAQWHIRNHINIAIRDLSSTIRIPVNIQLKIKKSLKENNSNHDLLPEELHHCFRLQNLQSLDKLDDNDNDLHQVISNEPPTLNPNINLSILDYREQKVISLLHGINCVPHTLQEIAPVLNLSKERVRQISKNAIKKLQLNISKDSLEPVPNIFD